MTTNTQADSKIAKKMLDEVDENIEKFFSDSSTKYIKFIRLKFNRFVELIKNTMSVSSSTIDQMILSGNLVETYVKLMYKKLNYASKLNLQERPNFKGHKR